ncbi:MAG: hypothetical protein IT342_20745 [Candidatus Melainabacteria bacterium]|nr:hypothetical protein [Candidatus Melainabacteria bacterium]
MQTIDPGGFSILDAQRDVEALFAFTERISAEAITEATSNCADPEANSEFTRLAQAAETTLMAALDAEDGPTLTYFDTALDELRLARQEFFRNSPRNRVNSHVHADNANRAFAAGIAEFIN